MIHTPKKQKKKKKRKQRPHHKRLASTMSSLVGTTPLLQTKFSKTNTSRR
jgi:hypothetical protein